MCDFSSHLQTGHNSRLIRLKDGQNFKDGFYVRVAFRSDMSVKFICDLVIFGGMGDATM